MSVRVSVSDTKKHKSLILFLPRNQQKCYVVNECSFLEQIRLIISCVSSVQCLNSWDDIKQRFSYSQSLSQSCNIPSSSICTHTLLSSGLHRNVWTKLYTTQKNNPYLLRPIQTKMAFWCKKKKLAINILFEWWQNLNGCLKTVVTLCCERQMEKNGKCVFYCNILSTEHTIKGNYDKYQSEQYHSNISICKYHYSVVIVYCCISAFP